MFSLWLMLVRCMLVLFLCSCRWYLVWLVNMWYGLVVLWVIRLFISMFR